MCQTVSVTSGHPPKQYVYIQVVRPCRDRNSLLSWYVVLVADTTTIKIGQ